MQFNRQPWLRRKSLPRPRPRPPLPLQPLAQTRSGWLIAVFSRFQRRPVGLTLRGAWLRGRGRGVGGEVGVAPGGLSSRHAEAPVP
jgi:hypothetical protein